MRHHPHWPPHKERNGCNLLSRQRQVWNPGIQPCILVCIDTCRLPCQLQTVSVTMLCWKFNICTNSWNIFRIMSGPAKRENQKISESTGYIFHQQSRFLAPLLSSLWTSTYRNRNVTCPCIITGKLINVVTFLVNTWLCFTWWSCTLTAFILWIVLQM